ncbi:MAG: hypothetical protein LUD81_04790 [Clostridiales bacterium]|nr:hypothetical protein [Clostridiales bacterium]
MAKKLTTSNYAESAKKIADELEKIPTKVSELENDKGYVTEAESTGSTFRITDNDAGIVYLASIQVTDGKPVLVYEEISK